MLLADVIDIHAHVMDCFNQNTGPTDRDSSSLKHNHDGEFWEGLVCYQPYVSLQCIAAKAA